MAVPSLPFLLLVKCYETGGKKKKKQQNLASTNSFVKCINQSFIISHAKGTVRLRWEVNTFRWKSTGHAAEDQVRRAASPPRGMLEAAGT